MEKSKNQRQPNPGRDKKAGKPDQHERAKQRRHERKNEPVASHPSDADKGMAAVQGREQSGQGQRIVTNQDEQRKATNTGNTGEEVMGEEETEGDPVNALSLIKIYDSKEIERKTPTME